MRLLLTLTILLPILHADEKKEPRSAEDWFKQGLQEFAKQKWEQAERSLTRCLQLDRDHAEALDARGSCNFMRARFADSVADFDRYLRLRPEKANGHWRRGISLYYAGEYDQGKKQFEGYEKVDTNDVENAVWHFLCVAKKEGMKQARTKILAIGKDRRVPMMEVYDLFKGKYKPEDVLAAAEADRLSEMQRKPRLFYAHLYLGLYHDLLGDLKKAREHLALAAGKYKIDHYMGEVARVHHELLQKKR